MEPTTSNLAALMDTITAPMRKLEAITAPMRKFWESQSALSKMIDSQNKLFGSLSTSKSPLAIYARELHAAATKFATPPTAITNAQSSINNLIKEKEAAEDNYYHNLVVENYERELDEANAENAVSKQQVIELETALRVIANLSPTPLKPNKKSTITLKPLLTPSQIVNLHESLSDIFEATLDQWRNLFSEDIKEFDIPIKLRSQWLTDIRVLFECLLEYKYISSRKYPSILMRLYAFSFQERIITAKQISATKGNSNYPYIGNYSKIETIIRSLSSM